MNFFIQVSNPACLSGTHSVGNESLADAVGSMNVHWLPDTFRCDWKIECAYIYIKCGRMKLFNNGLSVQGT